MSDSIDIPTDRIITPAEARILGAPAMAKWIGEVNKYLTQGMWNFAVPTGLAADLREALATRGWVVVSSKENDAGYTVWNVRATKATDETAN